MQYFIYLLWSLSLSSVGSDIYGYTYYVYFSSGSAVGTTSCGYVSIVNDNHVEDNEDFTVVLSGWDGTTAPFSNNNTAYITILDDDSKYESCISTVL